MTTDSPKSKRTDCTVGLTADQLVIHKGLSASQRNYYNRVCREEGPQQGLDYLLNQVQGETATEETAHRQDITEDKVQETAHRHDVTTSKSHKAVDGKKYTVVLPSNLHRRFAMHAADYGLDMSAVLCGWIEQHTKEY
jgi:hypothetical protein